MECHRCGHRADVEAGKFRRVAFERTPCASCELTECSAYTMAFDEERPGAAAGTSRDRDGMENEREDLVPLSVMSEAVAQLLTMPPAVRDVVCWRFSGMKYGEIARVQGVTVGAVENRHRRAMRRWPALRALFAEKAAKQGRRRPNGGQR